MILPRAGVPMVFMRALYLRSTCRIAMLGLCLSAVMCLSRPAAAAGRFSSGERKHEQPYAVIFGTVWGPDDHPRQGVKVKLRREGETKARWELYSDHNGEFALRVPAGKQDYVIWADLKGQKSNNVSQLRADEIRVHIDGDERVDTGLHLK